MLIPQLHLEQEQHVHRALELHREGMDFAAALHLLRSEGCAVLVSFDRAFEKLAMKLNTAPGVRLA